MNQADPVLNVLSEDFELEGTSGRDHSATKKIIDDTEKVQ